jgi:hypothetical protein
MQQVIDREIRYLSGVEHPHQLKHSIIGREIPALFVGIMIGVLIL